MAMRLLDTSVCIDFLRGRLASSGYQALRKGGAAGFAIPAVVLAELQAVAQQSGSPSRHMRTVEDFVKAFDIVPFDADSAREYCRIRDELVNQGKHGRLVGERHMMTAAIACGHRAVLVASDVRDYLRIPGLRLEDWGA